MDQVPDPAVDGVVAEYGDLYDMDADRTEMNNLAAQHTGRVRTMAAQWEAWARRAHVLPWIWKPAYGHTQKDAAAAKTAPQPAT